MIYRFFFILLTFLLKAAPVLASELPQEFDIRDINGASYIGAVRDQGECGSCWSFGTLAAAESTWNRAHGLYDNEAIDFSEAFLAWSLSPMYDGMDGCDGGFPPDPFTAMAEYGTPLESDFPYPIDENRHVTDPGDDLHWDAPRYTMKDWYTLPINDVETTRRVLHNIGTVEVGVHAGDDDFYYYDGGIFDQSFQTPTIENIYKLDHSVSLVGWNDEPGDGGMGYWILRNSWGEDWGEDGYMRIRYLNAGSNFSGHYFTIESWGGDSIRRVNTAGIDADTWSAGKTLNAHGIDLWGGAASSVINQGEIRAKAVSPASGEELTTARGVYLWGGPDGFVVNENEISAFAESENNQAFAYGTNLQGGRIENSGKITAEAQSGSTLSMAYGVWAANGGNSLEVDNSGEILARTDSPIDGAYGLWIENRGVTRVTNTGTISAEGGDSAIGAVFNGGPAVLENSGLIKGTASRSEGTLWNSGGAGILIRNDEYPRSGTAMMIHNSGTISGSHASVAKDSYAGLDLTLHLTTGSNLIGPAVMWGSGDTLLLTGHGTENEVFYETESLVMEGLDWSLSGDSDFETIDIRLGRLCADGALSGQTTVHPGGILGGSGTLTGQVKNSGAVAPGNSVGHFIIDGDFEQTADGTLAIEVDDHSADLLTVTGTAELAGTLAVLPDGYTAGGAHTFLEAEEAIREDFDSLETVAVLDAAMHRNTSGSLGLAVTRNSYESLADKHNTGLARNLDNFRADASGDMGGILDRLDLAADADLINANMAEMTPRIHGFAGTATLDDSQSRLSDLRRHTGQRDFRPYPDASPSGKTSVWADIASDYKRYDSSGGYFKTREKLYGLMLGVERNTASSLSLGIAAAVTKSDYDSRDTRDQGESEAQQAYLYGSGRLPGRLHGLHLSGAIGAGRTDLEAERAVSFAGRTARSDHDADIYSASLEGRYPLHMGRWRISPALGMSYVHLREDGFKESGAGDANLEIDSRNDDSVQSHLGGRIARPLSFAGLSMTPALQLEWRHEFNADSEPLEARLAGGSGKFTTPGRDLAEDMLLLGASLKANVSEFAYCNVSYNLEIQDSGGYTGHALSLQLGVKF